VTLLLKTGAKQNQSFPPGTDVYGDRFASGTVDNGSEQVTAWTFASQAAPQADLPGTPTRPTGRGLSRGTCGPFQSCP